MLSLAELQATETNLDILARKPGSLFNLITELRGLKITLVAGADADTNIAVAGIALVDTLLSVLEFTVADGNLDTIVDQTANCAITSAGNIRCTNSTATSQLIVVWYDQA
jgi:hypothetical protein